MGKEYSVKQWQALARQFIQKNIIRPDEAAYGALKFTPNASEVFEEGAQVLGFAPVEDAKPKAVKERTRQVSEAKPPDEKLFALLRKKRRQLADEAGVPSYIIFSDKSLTDMSIRKPQSIKDFAGIYGVGAKKLENFGEIFVALIREFSADEGVYP